MVANSEAAPAPSSYGLPGDTLTFYRNAMDVLTAARVPYLIGGAYAFARYTGIVRHTKDLDVFVRPADVERTLLVLADAGYRTQLLDPVWLGKAYCGDDFIDVIFSSGNGIATVDDAWFAHAIANEVLGAPVKLIPVEEMIWSKGFVMTRDRYDGADIAHLLRTHAAYLDWPRLLDRFGPEWRVLFTHLTLFGFIYPGERAKVPDWVMQGLVSRLASDLSQPAPATRLCRGTLLSSTQYQIDVEQWGYVDARKFTERGSLGENVVV